MRPLPLPMRITDLEKQIAATRAQLAAREKATRAARERLGQLEMRLKLLEFKWQLELKRRERLEAEQGQGK